MGKKPNNSAVYNHVINHIDDAIKNEWIKVYYQPVIRSLTGQVASAESLARWIDPEFGFLPPNLFIGPLEETEIIYKLDCFIVENVCQELHEHLMAGKPTFAVSVNFSRLDFVKCDMFKVVEDAVAKYDIPRDFLHIEITESMIAQDEELMKDIMEKFRNRGYEIWMDDFGNGYSSLTLLQDFEFDLIKMDMRFLANMNKKSRSIIHSMVNMAKQINIKTLCEGVETAEQADFMTSIGCGHLQGYYFGKPMPYDEMLENLKSKNIIIEKRGWHNFYGLASMAALDRGSPLHIAEYDGKSFHSLFMNEPYKKQISLSGMGLKEIDSFIFNPSSPLMSKYKQFAEKATLSKSKERLYFTIKGNYYQINLLYLGEHEGHYLFQNHINNISMDFNTKERDRLDSRLRELNNLHEVVLLLNYKEDISFPLLGGYIYMNQALQTSTITETCKLFAKHHIFSEDRSAFIEFMHLEDLRKKILPKITTIATKPFRIKQKDGSYKWRTLTLLPITGTGNSEILFTISAIPDELSFAMDKSYYPDFSGSGQASDELTQEYARLWYSLINSSAQKIFWKDKNRRFRGVSKSFLDFYEIKSLDDIIGKTDEEMHWHVDEGPYKGDELDVIGKGKFVFNAPGQCIVNGVQHNIICNKMPIYKDGEIIGLVGSFADVDEEIHRVQKLSNPSKQDTITRLMNNKFFMMAMMDYAMQYNNVGKNYAYILLHNANHKRIEDTYGSGLANEVLKEIGEKIIDVIKQRAVAARLKEAYFGILINLDSKEKLDALVQQLKDTLENINYVNKQSVTIKITTSARIRNEKGVTDESIHLICLDEIEEKEKKTSSQE